MSDRRKYRRLDANFVANVRTRQEDDTSIRDLSRVTNISQGGVFISTKFPFPIGSYVEFDFELPDRDQTIHVKGVVRWSSDQGSDPGMGIQFLEVSARSKEVLSDYVDERIISEYIRPLTRTPLHQQLLRLYFRKVGDSFTPQALATFLSTDEESLAAALRDFEGQGLTAYTSQKISFLPPPDDQSEAAIRKWIEENSG